MLSSQVPVLHVLGECHSQPAPWSLEARGKVAMTHAGLGSLALPEAWVWSGLSSLTAPDAALSILGAASVQRWLAGFSLLEPRGEWGWIRQQYICTLLSQGPIGALDLISHRH